MRKKSVGLSILFLLFAVCTSAQTVKIGGRVVLQLNNSSTIPVKGVKISIGKIEPGLGLTPFDGKFRETQTDSDGVFRINNVPSVPSDHSYSIAVMIDNADDYIETSFKYYEPRTDLVLVLKQRSFESFIERGKRSLEFASSLKMVDSAISRFTKALELKPNNSEALELLSQAYNKRGEFNSKLKKYTDSITDFTKAISLNPRNSLYYFNRGKDYFESGKYDLAVVDFSKVIELAPNVDAYYNRANAYLNLNDLVNAEKDLSKLINLDPKNPVNYYNRGMLYSEQKKYDLAVADFNEAVKLSPKDASLYFVRGIAFWESNKLDLAIADFSKTIELAPNNSTSYRLRCIVYNLNNNFVLAINDCNKAVQLDSSYSDNYVVRGLVHLKMNNKDLAIADFRKALSLDPNNQNAKDELKKLGLQP